MSEIDEVVADISQRIPDFYGRNDAPIWCVGEPTIQDIAELLRLEGRLTPNSQRAHELMDGDYRSRRKRPQKRAGAS